MTRNPRGEKPPRAAMLPEGIASALAAFQSEYRKGELLDIGYKEVEVVADRVEARHERLQRKLERMTKWCIRPQTERIAGAGKLLVRAMRQAGVVGLVIGDRAIVDADEGFDWNNEVAVLDLSRLVDIGRGGQP